MTDEHPTDDKHREDEPPPAEELDEPSTEKAPGEEPKAAKPDDPEPDHHAVGIGLTDGPQKDPDAV